MADPEFMIRRKILTYLTENYSEIFLSQYSMIAFRLIQYKDALRFSKVEDQIIKEITALPNYMELVLNKRVSEKVRKILLKYEGLYDLPTGDKEDGKPKGRLPTKIDRDTYYLAGVGEFELEDPVLCSRPLHFNESKESFVAYDSTKAHKEDPYGFKTCVVEKITFVPQLHTTHAETDQHVKKGET